MKKKYILLSLFCCLFFVFSVQAQNTIYVNIAASGTNNGSSWVNAFTDFQAGVNSATDGDSVFVAGGTYQPASGQSFSMKEGVKIYGGFAGVEASLSERDLSAGDTSILKGNGSRVIYNNNNGLTTAAVLDGFTIAGYINDNGAGLYNLQSSPAIANCIFSNNIAGYNGGAIFNNLSSPVITNCIFSRNGARLGGGIYNDNSSAAVIINCIFYGNNVLNGGGIFNENSSPIITNCIIYGNSGGSGVANYNSSSTPVITYSLVQGITVDAVNHNIDGTTDPKFADSANGDYHLLPGSPAINAGDNRSVSASDSTDLDGHSRIYNLANGGIVDLGSYEYQAEPDSTVITTQPENIVACTSTDKNLSVSATGANLHYQWQSSTDGGEAWANEANGATETLELTNIQVSGNGTQYRVIVTGDWNKDTSNVATLTAFTAPVISAQPQSQSVSEGASATFTATATGIDLQYQWQFYAGKRWNNIANATGVAFTITSVSKKDAGAYQVIITGTCGQTISLPATITVATKPGQNPKPVPPGQLPSGCTPVISLQPTSQSVCIGANATFSVTASDATGYQWQYASGKGKKAWTDIANATGSTLTVPSVSGTDDGTQYQVVISGNCGSETSKTATLKVESVAIVKEPQDAFVSLNEGQKGKQNNKKVNATFKVQAAGTGYISYQWQLSTDRSATWNDIQGATKSSLTISNITQDDDSLQYRVIVTGDCNNVTSKTATLKVNELNIVIPPLGGAKIPPGQAKTTIQHNYMVYPNPVTQSSVTIEDKLGNPLNGINLYDMAGHLVLSSQTQNAIINLQLPQLAAGPYTLQIIDQNHQAYPIQIMVQTTGQSLK
ncbi:MAG: immunoglobulin domain-containing protein [Ginsengibacter sp.]